MATVVTVTANPLLDHLAEGRMRQDGVVRVPGFRRVAGGKGLNVARVLARHGHRVRAVVFAGGDEGRALAGLVADDGVEAVAVPTAARSRIGFCIGATAAIEHGFAVTAGEAAAFADAALAASADADLVIVSGSTPDPACDGCYARIVRGSRAPVWVDSYGAAMAAALAEGPALAKPNREEMAATPAAWDLCAELHISDGAGSLEVRHGAARLTATPPQVSEVNPIGSGDCYLAALAHARLAGMDLHAQIAYACAAGAANAARADVARIGPADIAPLIPAVRIAA